LTCTTSGFSWRIMGELWSTEWKATTCGCTFLAPLLTKMLLAMSDSH
jgi:hypothetical protein